MPLAIEFCIPDRATYLAVQPIFADVPGLTVSHTSIVNGAHAALISAGNSFAEMNGGVDGIVATHLSAYTPDRYIQADVKSRIAAEFAGELPVGHAVVVSTQHPRHRHLIYAPTMRVPADVGDTLNAYLAFRGALVAMQQAGIRAASAPLFCTSAGCMSVERAARQMRAAFESVVSNNLVGGDWPFYHENDRVLRRF
jgi:O-acetyl-ADP-ribose deacetylase (regulator of RNase III)